jgi:CNT family concentrative nucleoside transporter
MNVSGAEAVVAAASPWVGIGESACLVRPYVDLMTESELHLSMTSGTDNRKLVSIVG